MPPSAFGVERPPSMSDVAQLAGVSHQTVSRVLNDSDSVRPQTRERVQAAITQLGYRRNESARTLATRRSKLIGIITADFVYYGPSSTLLSVQLAANEKGYLVSVAVLAEFTKQHLRAAIDQFLSQGVAGIIVAVPLSQIARELERIVIPVPAIAVASAWINPDSTITRVGVDQRVGVRRVLDYLQDVGCQQVGHFAGPQGWFDADEREQAWLEGCEARGMTSTVLDRGDWSAESGYRMAQRLLARTVPEAIFIANDQMSLGALNAFSEAGIKVGQDLRVVGFDDEPGSAYFVPSLTTVRQDYVRLGVEVVDALLENVAGRRTPNVIIPSELIVRDSA